MGERAPYHIEGRTPRPDWRPAAECSTRGGARVGRTTFVGEDEGAETLELQVPMVREAQALYPELRVCSFDRGFSQPRSALVFLTNRIATVSARRELSYRP